jgi:hypothetical protein
MGTMNTNPVLWRRLGADGKAIDEVVYEESDGNHRYSHGESDSNCK